MTTPKDPPKDAPAERGADVIGRTVELMKTQGLGWSKAMEQARRESVPATTDDDEEIADWPEVG